MVNLAARFKQRLSLFLGQAGAANSWLWRLHVGDALAQQLRRGRRGAVSAQVSGGSFGGGDGLLSILYPAQGHAVHDFIVGRVDGRRRSCRWRRWSHSPLICIWAIYLFASVLIAWRCPVEIVRVDCVKHTYRLVSF